MDTIIKKASVLSYEFFISNITELIGSCHPSFISGHPKQIVLQDLLLVQLQSLPSSLLLLRVVNGREIENLQELVMGQVSVRVQSPGHFFWQLGFWKIK